MSITKDLVDLSISESELAKNVPTGRIRMVRGLEGEDGILWASLVGDYEDPDEAVEGVRRDAFPGAWYRGFNDKSQMVSALSVDLV